MVSFSPKVNNDLFKVGGLNPFAASSRVAFTGGESAGAVDGFSERHGNGKAAGINSNGVHGEVSGTGLNGEHRLDIYG